MRPDYIPKEDWREKTCIGCKKHIEGRYNSFLYCNKYKGWHSTKIGDVCPTCYPIYKNIISVVKKQMRKDFQEAKSEMIFRFNECVKEY